MDDALLGHSSTSSSRHSDFSRVNSRATCRMTRQHCHHRAILQAGWTKLGVALTGRNTTGPPSRAAPWWVTLHMRVLQTKAGDRRRRQTTTDAREQNNTAPYTSSSSIHQPLPLVMVDGLKKKKRRGTGNLPVPLRCTSIFCYSLYKYSLPLWCYHLPFVSACLLT